MIQVPARFTAPLPTSDDPGDAGLVEIERRRAAFGEWWESLPGLLADALGPFLGRLLNRFDDFIAGAPAHTLAGVAVKLRALWRKTGLDEGQGDSDSTAVLFGTCLAAVADLERRHTG